MSVICRTRLNSRYVVRDKNPYTSNESKQMSRKLMSDAKDN